MKKTNVILVGLPGDMTTRNKQIINKTKGVDLATCEGCYVALTGEEIKGKKISPQFRDNYYQTEKISLIPPGYHKKILEYLKKEPSDSLLVGINFATREGFYVNSLFVNNNIPFIYGGTGADPKDESRLEKAVKDSNICAVIAKNMCTQIVGFQSLIGDFSDKNKGILKDSNLYMVESHQATKKDTSGTAKSMVEKADGSKGYFNRLGIPFTKDQIVMIRDEAEQRELGVPESFLKGHGWHTYVVNSSVPNIGIDLLADTMKNFLKEDTLKVFSDYQFYDKKPEPTGLITNLKIIEQKIGKPDLLSRFSEEMYRISDDKKVGFSIHYNPGKLLVTNHNVNGRDPYAQGAIKKALSYLINAMEKGERGKVYSMVDVLRGL